MNDEGLDPVLRYDKMVEKALRSVVRHAMESVIDQGLPGDHHFYVTFMTQHPGVDIPKYLKEQYPDEMTIVLQYQFYGLEVNDERFCVTLSFNNVPERLVIPLEAITIFADPSVNFALQFQPVDELMIDEEGEAEDLYAELEKEETSGDKTTGKKDKKEKAADDKEKTGKVISLENFRKE